MIIKYIYSIESAGDELNIALDPSYKCKLCLLINQFNLYKSKNKCIKFTYYAKNFVREKFQQNWSPDQISGYARKHNLFIISGEWIYQFILQDKNKRRKLYLHLRHQNKKYRNRYGSPKRQGPIKNRRFIDGRPVIVNEKKGSRIGKLISSLVNNESKQGLVLLNVYPK